MVQKNIVLYADDDHDDIQLVKEAFTHHSNNVDLVTVADGREAISFLQNLPAEEPVPCLVILDINMPKMDGKETLIKLRSMKRFKDVPAILFTTSSQPKDKDFAQKYNAGLITKPLDYKQMDVIASQFINHCTDVVKNNISKN